MSRRIRTGLLSVTFRKLSTAEIAQLAARAGLECIEWVGDVHAPPGDRDAARAVRRATDAAGLTVHAYGSYYRCRPGEDFEPVLATAEALGAPTVRIWVGDVGSDCSAAQRRAFTDQAARAVEAAAARGIAVACEFHQGTLTDAPASTQQLLRDVPGLRTLWQPPHDVPPAAQEDELRALLPRLAHVHVFHWRMPDRARLPLRDGADLWLRRLAILREHPAPAALLEFVRDDDPAALLDDATALREWAAAD
jgi:sugar phosphate isomerase/epimerase